MKQISRIGKSQSILSEVDTIIFDCDGVLWLDDEPIQGAAETIEKIREAGKRVFFVTNNSSKSRRENKERFAKFGIVAALDETIITSYLVAAYLSRQPRAVRRVYVIGREGIIEELTQVGIECHGGPADDGKAFNWKQELKLPPFDAVVVGYDDGFSYYKLAVAHHILQKNPSALFIATNKDGSYPSKYSLLPGSGALVAALERASRKESIALGKPSLLAWEALQAAHPEIDPKRTLMVGDKPQTDILFGRRCGMKTLLVESGFTLEQDLQDLNDPDLVPDYIASSINDLI